jgi:hypothetical protein
MLSASIPRHLDELIDMDIPPMAPPGPAPSGPAPVPPPPDSVPDEASPSPANVTPPLHPDVALVVATLIRKGILTAADIDATRRSLAAPPVSRTPSISPAAARLPNLLEALDSDSVRLIPRK